MKKFDAFFCGNLRQKRQKFENHFCSTNHNCRNEQRPQQWCSFSCSYATSIEAYSFETKWHCTLLSPGPRSSRIIKHVPFLHRIFDRKETLTWNLLNCLCCKAISRQPRSFVLSNNKKCLPEKRTNYPMEKRHWFGLQHGGCRDVMWNVSILTGQYPSKDHH